MVGELGGDGYLWEFANAVEIAPVTKVKGKANLWVLDDATTAAVASAATAPKADLRDPRGVHYWRKVQETIDQGHADAAIVNDPANWTFENEKVEVLFQRALTGYCATHQVRGEGPNAKVRVDRRNPYLANTFGGAEWVSYTRFVRALRKLFYDEWTDVIKPELNGSEDSATPVERRYGRWSGADDIAELAEIDESEFDRIVDFQGQAEMLRRFSRQLGMESGE